MSLSSSCWGQLSGLGMSMAGAHENTPSDKGVFHVSGPSTPAKLPLPEQVPPQNPKSKEAGRTPPP